MSKRHIPIPPIAVGYQVSNPLQVSADAVNGFAKLFSIPTILIPRAVRDLLRHVAGRRMNHMRKSALRRFIEGELTHGNNPLPGLAKFGDPVTEQLLRALDVIETAMVYGDRSEAVEHEPGEGPGETESEDRDLVSAREKLGDDFGEFYSGPGVEVGDGRAVHAGVSRGGGVEHGGVSAADSSRRPAGAVGADAASKVCTARDSKGLPPVDISELSEQQQQQLLEQHLRAVESAGGEVARPLGSPSGGFTKDDDDS